MKEQIRKKINDDIWAILKSQKDKIKHLLGGDAVEHKLDVLMELAIPASIHHQKVFPKYKGINKGKTVVITGTGPTFDLYHPMQDVIHMGLNDAISREDIIYDYYFVCDYEKQLFQKIDSCKYMDQCIKFWGYNYRIAGTLIPEYYEEKMNAERFYVESYDYGIYGPRIDKNRFFVYPPDISVAPLKSYGTTMFCVFQFALWTHPQKIYIVGCDCSKGHAASAKYRSGLPNSDFKYVIKAWRKAKEFADMYYPDIEIVSLNPVGLRGIFKDEYTTE